MTSCFLPIADYSPLLEDYSSGDTMLGDYEVETGNVCPTVLKYFHLIFKLDSELSLSFRHQPNISNSILQLYIQDKMTDDKMDRDRVNYIIFFSGVYERA